MLVLCVLTGVWAVVQGEAEVVSTQQGPATAVALAEVEGQPTAYFVGHNATLKISSLLSKAQVTLHDVCV